MITQEQIIQTLLECAGREAFGSQFESGELWEQNSKAYYFRVWDKEGDYTFVEVSKGGTAGS